VTLQGSLDEVIVPPDPQSATLRWDSGWSLNFWEEELTSCFLANAILGFACKTHTIEVKVARD